MVENVLKIHIADRIEGCEHKSWESETGPRIICAYSAAVDCKIPHSSVHKVLRTLLRARAYKIQTVQNQAQRYAVSTDILARLREDNGLLERVVFTFHVSGTVSQDITGCGALESLINSGIAGALHSDTNSNLRTHAWSCRVFSLLPQQNYVPTGVAKPCCRPAA